MALARRVERKQKGLSPPRAWCVCDDAAAPPSAEPPPCTSEPKWAESTKSHAHTEILYTFDRHFRHELQYLQKTLTWLHALWMFLGLHVEMRVSAGVQSRPLQERIKSLNYSVLWESLHTQQNDFKWSDFFICVLISVVQKKTNMETVFYQTFVRNMLLRPHIRLQIQFNWKYFCP